MLPVRRGETGSNLSHFTIVSRSTNRGQASTIGTDIDYGAAEILLALADASQVSVVY
jgi:hypothetical protein